MCLSGKIPLTWPIPSRSGFTIERFGGRISSSITADWYGGKLLITGWAGKPTKDMARDHGVEADVHLTGYLPRPGLHWWLGCADLFFLPFHDKPYNVGRWQNKIGDYMSLGRPTVINPVDDIKSLFVKYDIGLLAMWEPADLAENIIYLLENPEVAHRVGENIRQAALNYYWRILIRRLEEFYDKVLSLGVHDTGRPCC
jgi:glycosyltransferase involved in cell wall biosynthesis